MCNPKDAAIVILTGVKASLTVSWLDTSDSLRAS